MHLHKNLAYIIAVAIEEESGQRLIALPCQEGDGLAISDGKAIRFVKLDRLSSIEAIRAYVSRWHNAQEVSEVEMRTPAAAVGAQS